MTCPISFASVSFFSCFLLIFESQINDSSYKNISPLSETHFFEIKSTFNSSFNFFSKFGIKFFHSVVTLT
ncbi:hypothetical protein HOF65_06975 [bacterium]|nr:hypothetical protein [bacterium]MBT3853661.1 hypothetical protein [bacterium]MBT4633664.1 hypothetical protein [bacterium]MBT6778536.1 hypothetical protein [bacterium]